MIKIYQLAVSLDRNLKLELSSKQFEGLANVIKSFPSTIDAEKDLCISNKSEILKKINNISNK